MVNGARRPHIVFIFSDQHNPFVLGSQDDAVVRTPNLDRLSAAGVELDNCYCASPLCVPSRSALLTGQHPTRTGIFTNLQSIPSEQPTLAHVLTLAGYRTVLAGRMHFVGPDQRHGYAERLVGDITPSTTGLRKDVYGPYLRGTSGQTRVAVEHSGPGSSAVLQYDAAVVDAACDRIAAQDPDEPLFLTVGTYGPHCPYVCPPDLFEHYYQALPRPEDWSEFKESVHPAVRLWYQNRRVMDVDLESVHRARAAYYGMVELIDRAVGQIIEAVERSLGLEDTVVIYASDHGDMIGDKGLFWKSNLYDGSARVPAILAWPGAFCPGKRIGGLTSLLDLAPTLIELTGAPALPDMDGESLLDVLTVPEAQIDPQRVVTSYCADMKGDLPSAMVRRGPYKLVAHYQHEVQQLYNLEADGREVNDLGADPAYAGLRAELAVTLADWDPAAAYELIQRAAAWRGLIAQANVAAGVLYPDEWYADVGGNVVLDRPESVAGGA